MKTFEEIAADVKSTIETRGWTQREFVSASGAVCLSGAANFVINGKFYASKESCDFKEKLRKKMGQPIVDWNDDPKRTKEEVLTLLDRLSKGKPAFRIPLHKRILNWLS